MIPEFGVGLRNFLFEPRQHSIVQIRQRIQNQISRYMPFIRSTRVMFDHDSDDEYLENSHVLSITITYEVPNLNLSSTLILSREDVN